MNRLGKYVKVIFLSNTRWNLWLIWEQYTAVDSDKDW